MGQRLADMVVVVTGAGRGLGRATALAMAQEGAHLVLASRTGAELEAVAAEVEGDVLVLPTDVRNPSEVARLMDTVAGRFGRLDVLVNNAGTGLAQPTEDLPLAAWQRILDTNLTAPFLLCQAASRIMLPQGNGCIINICSLTSLAGIPMRAAYGASKGGLLALTHALAVEWGPRGLRVNALAPGFIRTALQDDLVRRGLFPMDRIAGRTPARRLGRPEEIAAAAVFLASHESSFVNGEVLVVDGGWLANGWVE
jgi:NAD(P)-dependent dehydrogenase (short-subunit alcohol dehydrogenase family)